jgi:hypothetical protein
MSVETLVIEEHCGSREEPEPLGLRYLSSTSVESVRGLPGGGVEFTTKSGEIIRSYSARLDTAVRVVFGMYLESAE